MVASQEIFHICWKPTFIAIPKITCHLSLCGSRLRPQEPKRINFDILLYTFRALKISFPKFTAKILHTFLFAAIYATGFNQSHCSIFYIKNIQQDVQNNFLIKQFSTFSCEYNNKNNIIIITLIWFQIIY
jgi:hypothetical protein